MMKYATILLAFAMVLEFSTNNSAAAVEADEIVVDIPLPPAIGKLPTGEMLTPLSAEDVDYAKSAARQAYQDAKARGDEKSIVVQLPGGFFQLTEPVVLAAEDGGDVKRPIIWRGETSGTRTRFSGGKVLDDWTEIESGMVQTTLPEVAAGSWQFRSIWSLGQGQQPVRCRLPKEGCFRIEKSGADRRTHFFWQDGDLKQYNDLSNVELVFIHDWSITRCPIQSIDVATKTLRVPRQIGNRLDFFLIDHWEPQPRYFLENSIEFLTEPGEWHLDRTTGKLTYRLRPGESADSLVLVAPKVENALTIAGTSGNPVRHIQFENMSFSHTAARPENENTYWGIQATWHHQPKPGGEDVVGVAPPRGAVDVEYAENCRFHRLEIQDVAATGLSLGRGTVACTLEHSRIANCGGNGLTVGAADQNDPVRANTIDHCRISRAGRVFYGAVGIWIAFAQETTVSNSIISHMPYTGISCGWLWSPKPTVARAQRIVNNDIGHCMQILSDGGGIYTLGFQPDSVLKLSLIHI
jgi:hypothetical protein